MSIINKNSTRQLMCNSSRHHYTHLKLITAIISMNRFRLDMGQAVKQQGLFYIYAQLESKWCNREQNFYRIPKKLIKNERIIALKVLSIHLSGDHCLPAGLVTSRFKILYQVLTKLWASILSLLIKVHAITFNRTIWITTIFTTN